MAHFESTAHFENGFWLEVLKDHAQFIHDALASQEKEEVVRAHSFIKIFEQLHKQVKVEDPVALSHRAEKSAKDLRKFNLHIIERHLVGKININLGPTFLSHMVNELEEYLRVLEYFMSCTIINYGSWVRRTLLFN